MKTIHKIEMPVDDETEIKIKGFCNFLKAGVQTAGHICLWYLVDTEDKKETECVIVIKGTGHNCDDVFTNGYFDSVFGSRFVWHVFISVRR